VEFVQEFLYDILQPHVQLITHTLDQLVDRRHHCHKLCVVQIKSPCMSSIMPVVTQSDMLLLLKAIRSENSNTCRN